jgi:hypothetical protein
VSATTNLSLSLSQSFPVEPSRNINSIGVLTRESLSQKDGLLDGKIIIEELLGGNADANIDIADESVRTLK